MAPRSTPFAERLRVDSEETEKMGYDEEDRRMIWRTGRRYRGREGGKENGRKRKRIRGFLWASVWQEMRETRRKCSSSVTSGIPFIGKDKEI